MWIASKSMCVCFKALYSAESVYNKQGEHQWYDVSKNKSCKQL